MVLVPQVLDLFWSAIEREVEKQGKTATFDRLRGDRRRPAVRGPAAPVPQRPHPVRRRPAAVRDRRRVPAARAPAGVGGHGRHRHPGVRRDRDLRGGGDDDERPPARAASAGRPSPSRCGSSRTARSSSAGRASRPATGTTRRPRRRVHRGRLVQVRRPRRLRRAGPAPSSTGARRTSSCCPTASTCSPRTSRTRCGSPGSGTRWRSRRSRGASRPSCCRPGRTRSPATRARRRRSRPRQPEEVRREIDAAVKAANGSLGPEPADRRLARLARGRLPAHPHVQGQARPGPGVGRDRRAAAGGRRG